MRQIKDKRHDKRIKIVQGLFASFFLTTKTRRSSTIADILKNIDKLDPLIEKYAPKYTKEKIAKVDLSILRLAVYELIIKKQEPPKVIINEAVELAKELGGEKSPSFVNAVLGKIYDSQQPSKSE